MVTAPIPYTWGGNNMKTIKVWKVSRQSVPNFHVKCYTQERSLDWANFIINALGDVPIVVLDTEVFS